MTDTTTSQQDVQSLGTTCLTSAAIDDDQPAGSITTYVVDLR